MRYRTKGWFRNRIIEELAREPGIVPRQPRTPEQRLKVYENCVEYLRECVIADEELIAGLTRIIEAEKAELGKKRRAGTVVRDEVSVTPSASAAPKKNSQIETPEGT